jgi:hypothetical protein
MIAQPAIARGRPARPASACATHWIWTCSATHGELLLPLPLIDRPQTPSTDVFPPLRRRPATAVVNKRVAVVASGGAGAAVALIGAARAFEEAGIEPELISGCSGGGMFGSLWAAGLSRRRWLTPSSRGSRSTTSIRSGCASRGSR